MMYIPYNEIAGAIAVSHRVNGGVVGDDLLQLNRHILSHAGTHAQNVNLLLSIDDITVCVARLKLSADELRRTADGDFPKKDKPIDVYRINREYLIFARQEARDVENGHVAGLVRLGITLDQVHVLSELSNRQIEMISACCEGTVYEVPAFVLKKHDPLHRCAAPYYPSVMLSLAAF